MHLMAFLDDRISKYVKNGSLITWSCFRQKDAH